MRVRYARGLGGWCARRDVVVTAMTIGAGDALVRVSRGTPLPTTRFMRLLVTLETQFRFLRRGQSLETENQPRLLAASLDMAARRAMAAFTLLLAMHVAFEF